MAKEVRKLIKVWGYEITVGPSESGDLWVTIYDGGEWVGCWAYSKGGEVGPEINPKAVAKVKAALDAMIG